MRALLLIVLVVLLLGAAALFYFMVYPSVLPQGKLRDTVQRLEPPPVEIPARGPQDYHLLEGQGGIPQEEAIRAGLITADYAYLVATKPVNTSAGIVLATGVKARGLNYDFCFKFNTTAPREQYLEFNLEGKWQELHFGFGFDDNEPTDPTGQRAITLIVKADGQPVFGPAQLKPEDKPLFTKLAVAGVYHVTFISQRDGAQNVFAPVLLDPFVKNPAPQAN